MDKNLKDHWITALTDGSYSQTQGVLKEGNSFCCLGVLCDISKKGSWGEYGDYEVELAEPDEYGEEYVWCEGTDVSALESGLGSDDAETLAEMNDGGRTFVEIAAWIEENVAAV